MKGGNSTLTEVLVMLLKLIAALFCFMVLFAAGVEISEVTRELLARCNL